MQLRNGLVQDLSVVSQGCYAHGVALLKASRYVEGDDKFPGVPFVMVESPRHTHLLILAS